MANKPVIHEGSTGTIVIYQDDAEKIRVQALLYDETLWLTQKMLTELFDTSKQNISKHLRRIFEDGELIENAVVNYLLTTASDGKSYRTKLYNLDAVIAVGYRVNSKRATSFRIWATQILREYIVKGFAMDDERLKNPEFFLGKDYFDEMLERIRDIRSSERRFYQKITDIYANALSTTTKMLRLLAASLQRYRTNCIGQLRTKQRLKSSIHVPTIRSQTWV